MRNINRLIRSLSYNAYRPGLLRSIGMAFGFAVLSLFVLMGANINVRGQAPGSVDTTFQGGVMKAWYYLATTESVQAIAIQPDGKHIIVGYFRMVNSRGRNYIARLNADGSLDTSFDTGFGFNNNILAVAIQQDGKIIVGGTFGWFTNNTGVSTKGKIARLNSDGTLDSSFSLGSGADNHVRTIVLQPDGKILIGGDFIVVDGTPRRGIARLNTDGSVDTDFNPGSGIDGFTVRAIGLQTDGKVLIGGEFTMFNGTPRNDIARINNDGSLDQTFVVGNGSNVSIAAIALQADGKIIIGGNFNEYNNLPAVYIARLNVNGSKDAFIEGSTCMPSPCGNRNLDGVTQLTVTSNGQIYASTPGRVTPTQPPVWGGSLQRFNSDGSRDGSFITPGYLFDPSTPLNRHAVQADGSIITNTSRSVPLTTEGLTPMVRFNANGSQDGSYLPLVGQVQSAVGGSINDIMLQPDGKVVVGGNFNIANTTARRNLARFNFDGTLDTTFTAQIDFGNIVYKVLRQPDGKILLGGTFVLVNGVSRQGVARLNENGTLDNTFNVGLGAQGYVFSVAIQPDGKIIIGGSFGHYNGVPRSGIARLNIDGSLDTTFDPGTGGIPVHAIAVQADGKIVIGGTFFSFNGVNRPGLARLNSNGSVDTMFDPGVSPLSIYALKILSNNQILIGGVFLSYNGTARTNVARINSDGSLDTTFGATGQNTNGAVSEMYVQTNGRIIIGGTFGIVKGQTRRGVARLNSNGSLDAAFGYGALGADPLGGEGFIGHVVGMAFDEATGKLYYGASFSTFNNIGLGSLVRLFVGSTQAASAPFDYDGDGRTDVSVFRPSIGSWYISQSSNNAFRAEAFGTTGDRIVPADFDGEGKTDVAVWRPSTGYWYSLDSSNGTFRATVFGQNGDVPVPADFDGDGKSDICVFRPSIGTFYLLYSSDGSFHFQQWGQSGDVPVVGDYDGDGKADFSIYRGAISTFYYLRSSDGGVRGQQWGASGDKPIAGDFDADGKTDIAVYRPSTGAWYAIRSSDSGFIGVGWGTSGDVPAAGDYDGDGKLDVAVFRPSTGTFYILQSTNSSLRAEQFGTNGDVPTPSAFVP